MQQTRCETTHTTAVALGAAHNVVCRIAIKGCPNQIRHDGRIFVRAGETLSGEVLYVEVVTVDQSQTEET